MRAPSRRKGKKPRGVGGEASDRLMHVQGVIMGPSPGPSLPVRGRLFEPMLLRVL